jgi:hypothetical protein
MLIPNLGKPHETIKGETSSGGDFHTLKRYERRFDRPNGPHAQHVA